MEEKFIKNGIIELVDECKDINLLYIIKGLLVEEV